MAGENFHAMKRSRLSDPSETNDMPNLTDEKPKKYVKNLIGKISTISSRLSIFPVMI